MVLGVPWCPPGAGLWVRAWEVPSPGLLGGGEGMAQPEPWQGSWGGGVDPALCCSMASRCTSLVAYVAAFTGTSAQEIVSVELSKREG